MAITRSPIHHLNRMIASAAILSLIILLASFTPVTAGGGTLQLSLQGYGSVPGELRNAIIQPNNSVSMLMVVNDKIQTSNGPVQVTSNGTWIGLRNGSSLSGPMRGIVGKAQVCVLVCMNADFVGQGRWSGSLSGSRGRGIFNGTITFTNSPMSQIQNGQPYLMSGTWSADFELPVPEYGPQTPTIMIAAFTIAILLLIAAHRPRAPEESIHAR